MSEKDTSIPPFEPPSYEASNGSTTPQPPRRTPLAKPPPLELPALVALRNKRVILASSSLRRKQLLAQIGLTNVEVIPSQFEENLPKNVAPFEYVLETATAKAFAVYEQEVTGSDAAKKPEPGIIIAADTIAVDKLGNILEKPRSEAHHIAMLKTLRDQGTHQSFTAVVCISPLASARDPGYAMDRSWVETLVTFDRDVTDELLLAYVRTREGADKAGGYAVQGTGAVLVDKIDGSFDSVMGLPLRCTLKLIEKVVAKADDEDLLVDEDALEQEDGDEDDLI